MSEIDPEKLLRLTQAFTFLIKVDTFAINHAAMAIDREIAKGNDDLDHQATWDAVYLILSHAANLSKIFWPIDKRPEIQIRGRVMRKIFDVTETSPMHDRAVRNGFEHLDELVHDWYDEEKPAGLIDLWVGPDGHELDFPDHHVFRSFDHTEGIVSVGPRRIDIRAISREADRLYDRWRELRDAEVRSD